MPVTPGQPAQRAFEHQLADAPVVWVEHHARRGDHADALFRCTADQVVGLGGGDGHRLVEVDVLAGLNGVQALRVVQADGRANRHGVHAGIGQQFLIGHVVSGHAIFLGGCLGAARHRVAHRGQSHPVLHVGQAEVHQRPPDADGPRADYADSNRFFHSVNLLRRMYGWGERLCTPIGCWQ